MNDQANNGNKRYKSQFYLHSGNETLEENLPASPSKMTEQPYLFINLDENNFESDSVSNSDKELTNLSVFASKDCCCISLLLNYFKYKITM